MLTAINIRSGVAQTGTAAFSDLMLNQVQHNILWGQGDNLSECSNGWLGAVAAALTVDCCCEQ